MNGDVLPSGMGSDPVAVFGTALADGGECLVRGLSDDAAPVPIERWVAEAHDSDIALVGRCEGPTLDIGCGPGRLAHALAVRGIPSLGIDVTPQAVDLARLRGAHALVRDVFGQVPAAGRWRHVLLADGNIGIGGDPVRLLRRAKSLVGRGGTVVIDLAAPGTRSRRRMLTLEHGGRRSRPFGWSVVSVDVLGALASAAALTVLSVDDQDGRWVAELRRDDGAVE